MTRCFKRLTIPSTAAVRLSSRTLPTLPRPRPLTVWRTRWVVLIGRAAAEPVDILSTAQLGQSFEGCFDQIVRIRRAEAFGQDVADARQLDHGAHTARRNDAGAFG